MGGLCVQCLYVRAHTSKYEHSLAKQQKSLNKYYCIDNGLRSAVLLPQSDDNGKLLENTVFLHLNRHLSPADRIFYYQESAECDFVVQSGEHIEKLIQVTWDMTNEQTKEREINGLIEASKYTKCDNLTIITIAEETVVQRSGKVINVVPAWKWLLGR